MGEAGFDSKFEGPFDVEFMHGEIKTIDVAANIVDAHGHPIYLQSDTGRLYNWMNILSLKKIK